MMIFFNFHNDIFFSQFSASFNNQGEPGDESRFVVKEAAYNRGVKYLAIRAVSSCPTGYWKLGE